MRRHELLEGEICALTGASLRSPAAVAVGVAVTVLFGAFAIGSLPIQLFPDIERPQISIQTGWRAESPREVEQQIIEPEEEVLQGIPGLQQMDAYANQGSGYVNLTFAIGTDIQETLVDVIGRLNRIPSLPPDSDRPFVQLANAQDSNASLLYVFMQVLPGNKRDVQDYEPFIRYNVVPRIEAIPGVGSVGFNEAGAPQELQVVVDPMKAAALGIQIPQSQPRSMPPTMSRAERSMPGAGNTNSPIADVIRSAI